MSDSAISTTPVMGGAFVNDAAAQAEIVSRQRHLLWRKRLLPFAAMIGLLLLWWAVVEFFGIRPFIAP